MSFLGKARKEDLRCLAEELGEHATHDLKVIDLKGLITNSKNYEEVFVKGLMETIIETRQENEKKLLREETERKEIERIESEKEKEKLELEKQREEREFQLEKLRIEKSQIVEPKDVGGGKAQNYGIEFSKLMPKFNPKEDDIVLYLSIFERQAKRVRVDPKHWVSSLLTLLPSDIIQILARESEENFEDYEYIKGILLKRFKLSPERFRKKFMQHQRNPERTWREFVFELNGYFQEWIDGLKINDFNSLKDLIVTDQLKRRIPYEIKEHFVDDWPNIVSPTELADKVDLYESVREDCKKPVKKEKYWERKNQFSDNSKHTYTKNAGSATERKNDTVAYKPNKPTTPYKFTCFSCGREGHRSLVCPNKRNVQTPQKAQTNSVQSTQKTKQEKSPILTAKITTPVSTYAKADRMVDQLKIVKIRCGDNKLNGIYDSGAQISVVRADLVKNLPSEGDGKIEIASAFGEREVAPLKIIYMQIDDEIHGKVPVTCAVSEKLVNDLLICPTAYEALNHNVILYTGVKNVANFADKEISKTKDAPDMDIGDDEDIEGKLNLSSGNEANENQKIDNLDKEDHEKQRNDGETKESFIELQKIDDSLKDVWKMAEVNKNSYFFDEGILMHSENVCGEDVQQVVVPLCKRQYILSVAHEIPLAGHLGEQKTKQRIKYSFYWPSLKKDVKKFCESCKPCQLRRTVTYRDRIPIRPLVRPENPFEVWSVDCIGPLEPPSRRGHKYVISAIDLCTRWAEAIPVRNITAKTTCEVLMKIFTQTGFPTTICTDQGPNFTAQLTEAFLTTLGVAPRFSTPGHPESMGAVERWNRTLKNMLNKTIQEQGRNWDLHLPYLLFAYREVPHSTTGMSPFQLVYGRLPPGPLKLLKEVWLGHKKIPLTASPSVEQYLKELVEKLENAHKIAAENSEKTQNSYASHYNLRSREKTFNVGDQVLILQPSSSHKLLSTWIGPATIIELPRPSSVLVKLEDGSTRNLHFNKIRPFIARVNHIGLVFEQDADFGELYYAPTETCSKNETSYAPITSKNLEVNMKRAVIEENKFLSYTQKGELMSILEKYEDLFSKRPGLAKVDGHAIRVTAECTPKRLSPYRIPITLQEEVDRQVSDLIEQGLIEPSSSDWAHPVVCVAKKDGTIRLCVDFRHLNGFTISDAYPMKIAKDLLYEIGQANFITVLDLTKGYWQIPMDEESKAYTAFVTHSGHYQWRVMPFGLKNAGSTFQKSMDKLFQKHKKYCRSYIDDVAIFSQTWQEHLYHLEQIFQSVKDAGLTVNLEKCNFGQNEVKFLGHVIGSGKHSPDPLKVETIQKISKPSTKKELRSLIGLASYYREYIPKFSSLVLPLTNLTRKNVPNSIPWNPEAEDAFKKLKEKIASMTSMFTPKLDRPFQLYTDASANAVGACLAQIDEKGQDRPIAFFSKKLTDTQKRWSTIEREAYSVIEALKKFDTWIFGAEIEVISDHNPLTYLTCSVPHGAKLARWSLALQRYNLNITYRKGSRHSNADSMSRLTFED